MLEIINPHIERGRIRHALFDFDGTLSLIREGWQDVMIPMMVELLRQTPTRESEAELTAVVADFVTRLTGKQTIYQMMQLATEVTKRGGCPEDPLTYKRWYLDRLWERIAYRVAGLKSGQLDPDEWMVPGARAMLDALKARDVACYLASGTDEAYVLDEAAALGLTDYFTGGTARGGTARGGSGRCRIYGAQDDYLRFSKKLLIERIIREHELHGPEFAAFGDGFVEIEDTKHVGGIAVGVASDEANRTGVDAWKRNRLIEAGADLIIPDFRECAGLVAYLYEE